MIVTKNVGYQRLLPVVKSQTPSSVKVHRTTVCSLVKSMNRTEMLQEGETLVDVRSMGGGGDSEM